MNFEKYQSLARVGNSETQGVLEGIVHLFYKIDGTNGSVWRDSEGEIRTGSRNRELAVGDDNAGFHSEMIKNEEIRTVLELFPYWRIYGEWLVPHTLKTYKESAWRKFYVFDIVDTRTGEYVQYDEYASILKCYGVEFVPLIVRIENPTVDDLYKYLEKSGEFLCENGQGEGIVIKNYGYRNQYGRQTWGKLISNEFKNGVSERTGAPVVSGSKLVEDEIVTSMLSKEYILKELHKIILNEPWEMKLIPKVLGITTHEFITDEIGEILRKFKNPTINFKTLTGLIQRRIKEVLKEEGFM